jgi:branched-chain amino acid aminotransferase
MASHWGITVHERMISIDEVIGAIESGTMKEIFGTGTAAVISPVGSISYKGESFRIGNGGVGELSKRLYDEIVAVQYWEKEDPFGWVHDVSV